MKKRIRVIYSGTVQGVGFRSTTRDLARRLHITGFVRNVRDGSVELLAEADQPSLESLIDDIADHFSRYVRAADVTWLEATNEYKDFDIAP